MTPAEILRAGSFGGTYYRSIYSGLNQTHYKDTDVISEFPSSWFDGLNIKKMITSNTYDTGVNTYGVKCGETLDFWEEKQWMRDCDPYGQFQWYCRFYQGRRCSDDTRQIARANGVMSSKGRWRNFLINKIVNQGISSGMTITKCILDKSISPKVRQLLQHWGYRLTARDLVSACKAKKIDYEVE